MRGHPLLELVLVGLLGVLLGFPLASLTRARRLPGGAELVGSEETSEAETQWVWLDVRFSHAPERFEVFYEDVLVGEGGGALRWDGDVAVSLDNGVLALRLAGTFPEEVTSAYVEVSLEPEGVSGQRRGIWTRGEFSHAMEFRWTEN